MKTAVSIPDDIFERAERLAKRHGRSRSDIYSSALKEYVARLAPEDVTDAMNRVCDDIEREPDRLVTAASRRVLERSEW